MERHARERRVVLKRLAAGAGAVLSGAAAAGCTPPGADDGDGENKAPTGPPSPPIARPIAEFPPGSHVTVMVGDHPVEVVRTERDIAGRSLLCTHWGCLVRWVAADQRYACACHKGLFDADGNVIAGPATKPMLVVPVRVEGEQVIIGAPAAGASPR